MNALPAPQFDSFEEGSSLRLLPTDWPGPGPIDLELHDLPHASASLEWWYLNCHLQTVDGRDLSLFAAFFREQAGLDPESGEIAHAHSVAWAICDPAQSRYSAKVAVDALAPVLGLAKLDAARGTAGSRFDGVLRELLQRGQVPAPTRLVSTPVHVGNSSLALDYGGDKLFKRGAREYVLSLYDERTKLGCDLSFVPQKRAVRYGADGIVHGVQDELMFYYFIPRCKVSGHVTIDGKTRAVGSGSGWFDHEFGISAKAEPELRAVKTNEQRHTAWRWVSLQLDNGYDLSIFVISRPETGEILDDWLVLVDPDGHRRAFSGVNLRETKTWRSTRSFVSYPVAFALELAEARLSLDIRAVFPDQEVLTIISDPGFWEGRVSATGRLNGREFTAKGWVECKGFRFSDVDGFLAAVGSEVRERLSSMLPSEPQAADLERCVVRGEYSALAAARYVNDLAAPELVRGLTQPIMEIAMRGGKAWRSYAALACIDVVGGDSRKFSHWMVLPELLHVGSLIVDDVEDESVVRRGGPTCHALFGSALAINAGTAAYFLAEPPLFRDAIAPESKLRIYGLYFDALRAGHAGQALDLLGHEAETRHSVDCGDTSTLEKRVLSVHRLKTAVPAGAIARIGAILGGGSDAQIEGVGQFFEALGLAFQILDDVLNLRGFERDIKERGEDVRQGKVTLPIVKALERLPNAEREWLYCALRSKSDDPRVVQSVIATIEDVGALNACVDQAEDLVDRAWTALDPLLEDSQFKLMFRAFSRYLLERHY